MDYLKEWKNNYATLAWKKGIRYSGRFSALDETEKTLRDFFPESQIIKSVNNNPENFIIDLLKLRNDSTYITLVEIANIIKYYNNHPQKEAVNLKNTNGEVNFNEFRDRLFELFVNKLFNDNGLKTKINESYTINKLIKKPLDSVLEFESEDFLVECKRIHIDVAKSLEKLALRLKKSIEKFGKDFHLSEVFCGYIVFKDKTLHNKTLENAYKDFNMLIKSYFAQHRNNKSKKIVFKHAEINSQYEILITTNLIEQENVTNDLKDKYPHSIIFLNENLGIKNRTLSLKISLHVNHLNLKEKITEKIKKKIAQHSSAPFENKIFVFGFESIYIPNSFREELPDIHKILSEIEFNKIVSKGKALIFLIKHIYEKEYNLNIGTYWEIDSFPNLKKRIDNIKINLR